MKELEALVGLPLCGGIPNTRPVRKTMEIPEDALEKYLRGSLGTHDTGRAVFLLWDSLHTMWLFLPHPDGLCGALLGFLSLQASISESGGAGFASD